MSILALPLQVALKLNFYTKTFALSLSRTNVQEIKKRKEKKRKKFLSK